MTYDRRLTVLLADCVKIESRNNRDTVDEIIDSARVNADDTVRDERLPEADWDKFFTATLGTILSEGRHNHHVVAFFTKRGITF